MLSPSSFILQWTHHIRRIHVACHLTKSTASISLTKYIYNTHIILKAIFQTIPKQTNYINICTIIRRLIYDDDIIIYIRCKRTYSLCGEMLQNDKIYLSLQAKVSKIYQLCLKLLLHTASTSRWWLNRILHIYESRAVQSHKRSVYMYNIYNKITYLTYS